MSFERTAVLALLIGFALFGLLRTRSAVTTIFRIRPGAALLGAASMLAVLAALFLASRTALGAVVGGLVVGVALYAGSWRRQAR